MAEALELREETAQVEVRHQVEPLRGAPLRPQTVRVAVVHVEVEAAGEVDSLRFFQHTAASLRC